MIIDREYDKGVIGRSGNADIDAVAAVDYHTGAETAERRSCYRSAGGIISLDGNACNFIFIQSILRKVTILVSVSSVYTLRPVVDLNSEVTLGSL